MPPTPIRSFVCSFARSLAGALVAKIFRRRENFGDAKILEKKVWAVAIDFVQESSKSELSLRFLSRLKFENFARHFLANSADRPRICANLIMIRPNPGTIGRIHQKVASAFFVIGTKEMSCSQHTECLASNARKVLLRRQGMSCLEHTECPAWNTRNALLGS